MKLNNVNCSFLTLLFIITIFFNSLKVQAQSMKDTVSKKDCCMMKNGKMMHMKAGKVELMEREMTMKNGTKCMANGECITQEGEKIIMKEGECIDIYGNVSTCAAMLDNESPQMKPKENIQMTILYSCPKHAEIQSDQPGICPKCGTELVEKKR